MAKVRHTFNTMEEAGAFIKGVKYAEGRQAILIGMESSAQGHTVVFEEPTVEEAPLKFENDN